MDHLCLRCGYQGIHRTNLNRHFNRKKTCSVKYLDIPVEHLLNNYDQCYKSNIAKFRKLVDTGGPEKKPTKTVICDKCYEMCNNRSSLHYHRKNRCPMNVQHADS